MKNIFDELINRGVPYAVGVEYESILSNKSNILNQKYFIIICKSDKEKISGLNFKDNFNLYILERDLEEKETEEFKNNILKYDEILNNNDGRMYELKDHSFKAYYIPFRKEFDCRTQIKKMKFSLEHSKKIIDDLRKQIKNLKGG